jgi:hypothetical protein
MAVRHGRHHGSDDEAAARAERAQAIGLFR